MYPHRNVNGRLVELFFLYLHQLNCPSEQNRWRKLSSSNSVQCHNIVPIAFSSDTNLLCSDVLLFHTNSAKKSIVFSVNFLRPDNGVCVSFVLLHFIRNRVPSLFAWQHILILQVLPHRCHTALRIQLP